MRVMESTSGTRTVVEPTAAWEELEVDDREEYRAGIAIEPLLAGLVVGIL